MVWWILAAVFILLAVHPFVTYPLSLAVAAKVMRCPPVPDDTASPSRIAILFCAYNEEAVIETKLHNCVALKSRDPATSIFVYTDGCTDRTVEIVRGFEGDVHLVEGRERRGKSAGMNKLARLAQAHGAGILFFTDANVELDDDALTAVRRAFADPDIGCITGHLEYVNSDESPTALVGASYWSLDGALKRMETSSGSCVGADGSIFAIRAPLFRDVPENIIDDFFTSMSVLCDGWRCIYAPTVIARERSATKSVEEYRRKVRIACRAFNCHRLLWPRLRQMPLWDLYKYVSHKLLRWLMAFWVGGALVAILLGLLSSPLSWTAVAAIGLASAAAGLLVAIVPGPPFSHAREAVIAIVATGVGVLKSLKGERFQTWTQATTTRQALGEPKTGT